MLIETMPGWGYSLVDDRYKNHKGDIIDLGCFTWDWSAKFIKEGNKKVIGADPQENTAPGDAILFPGVVGPFTGVVKMDLNIDGQISSLVNAQVSNTYVDMLSWKDFCIRYGIEEVSILKVNIESSEYSLLASMNSDDFSKIDQIAISFHDWLHPNERIQKEAAMSILIKNGFNIQSIYPRWGWILATKRGN